ncbi:probable glycosyltransferase At5g03795 [Trifolium pratense]|uniref:probable glycosyltransferase At5g03795 n=1 Tax=Trifolium pratense TaxID=57577 RepID=UPI001E692387|nr:probable glycosyltransferase At5g03795 [Trifolium pratense]
MGQDIFSLFQLQRKKLLCLIAITFALILAFQYFELPYGNFLLVQTSNSNSSSSFHVADSPSASEILYNNVTLLNQTNLEENPIENVNDTTSTTGLVSEPGRVESDGPGRYDNNTIGVNLTRDVQAIAPTYLTPPPTTLEYDGPGHYDNNTISMNLTREVQAIAPTYLTPPPTASPPIIVLLNDSEVTGSMNDERFKPLKDDVNVIESNSTITTVPKETKDSVVKVPEVTTISEMQKLLFQNYASYRSMRPRWSSTVDQELLQARSEIENAPVVTDVGNLHAPLYHNVSMFKRSYELMEKTLKVYVYREGAKPIMHLPYLLGIYASEGWFMRLMEVDKQFVTKDAKKAHLFYIPFSSRMLEETLYVANSHTFRNLRQYLNNYVDTIAAKHSFWNRTGGADHFFVACHDWAPMETDQRMANCLRSLCNADVKEGFVFGKDTSLPETYVRNAQNPTRGLGGKRISSRKTLAFYAGGIHGYVRPILLQHWENKDPDMKIFGILPHSKGNRNYIQYMKSSKYCICPKGYEVNSPRVVEAIVYECVPVIISDNFVPPFLEVLNWESFAVFVLEKDIPNLKSILLSIPRKRYLQMQMRVRKVQQHFLWHRSPVKYDIFHMILHSIWYNRVFTARTG